MTIFNMTGSTISKVPTMLVCIMAWQSIWTEIFVTATSFKMLESSSQKFHQGFTYLIGKLMGLAFTIYKCQSMGLLPTHASGELAFN
ncbi:ER membrane protein complex subunit 4-like [Artibeus jamaicensis]|uniref:ER membrane protein complex subunit 4-like n=1 Tax=Artibeus jamaicensis TaxID=9417 RepID=UPI00235AF6BD|nr:ER membrane protein complex subunit 4-like [Artibeus jamaicensis]